MRHAGADAPRAGHPQRLQPAGPADQSGGRRAPDCRRAEARADRAGGAGAAAAWAPSAPGSCTAPTASTSCRRPATPRCRSAATARCTPSTCTRPTSACRKAAAADLAGGDAAENAGIVRGVLDGRQGSGARRRGAQRRRRAVRGRHGGIGAATGLRGGRGAIDSGAARATLDRMVRAVPGRRRRHERRRTCWPPSSPRRGAIVADAPRARSRRPRWPGAPRRRQPRGALFEARLARPGRGQHHRRVQAAIAVEGRAGRRPTTRWRSRAAYERGGAAAISVLTEPTFFDGALEHLAAVRAARGRARCCARTSSSTSTSCSRRGRPAPMRCC